jgi:hypothetical protein
MGRCIKKVMAFLLMFVFSVNVAFVQTVQTEFYNKNWQITNGEDKYYKREIVKEHDSLYRVKDYYLNGNLEMEGSFTSLDHQVKDGRFIFYYGSGEVHYDGKYCKGLICGEWKVYSKTGELTRMVNYDFEIPECPDFDTTKNAYLNRDSLNYIIVDYMPRFVSKTYPGFDEYVQSNLFIPPLINKYKIKDRAEAKFTINAKGELCDIEVKSLTGNKTIIREVCRVLVNSERWVPASSNEVPVPVDYVMPVTIN